MDILLATGNRNKYLELSSVAERFGHKLHLPQDVLAARSLPPIPEIIEDGSDYEANARIKAQTLSAWADMPTIGDDSGLEVDVLGGAPGVLSARYGGPGLNDHQRCNLLLQAVNESLEKDPSLNRKAAFVCALCFVEQPSADEIFATGTLCGSVLNEFRGERGFGYDPIILIADFGKTLAEVSFETVVADGFRARAAKALFEQISS